jgi:hypothetical protein
MAIATTSVSATVLKEGFMMLATNNEEDGTVDANRGIIPTTIMDRIKEMMGADVVIQITETPIERGIHINTTTITATLGDGKYATIENQHTSTATQDERRQRSTATLQNERKRSRIVLL